MGLKVRRANGRLAAVQRTKFGSKHRDLDDTAIREARDAMLAARLEEAMDEAMDPDPPYEPLSTTQRKRLSSYLLGRR